MHLSSRRKKWGVAKSKTTISKGEYIQNIISTYFHTDNHDPEIDPLLQSAEDLIDTKQYSEAKRIIETIYEKYGPIQIVDDLNTKIRILKR